MGQLQVLMKRPKCPQLENVVVRWRWAQANFPRRQWEKARDFLEGPTRL
jgi:hypothetical protein